MSRSRKARLGRTLFVLPTILMIGRVFFTPTVDGLSMLIGAVAIIGAVMMLRYAVWGNTVSARSQVRR